MGGDVKLEKGVPLPGQKLRYPYLEMEVGDSFFREGDERLGMFCNLNWRWGKRLHRKYVCRKVDGGIRVWRVE